MAKHAKYSPLNELTSIYYHVPPLDPDFEEVTDKLHTLILWMYSKEPDLFKLADINSVPGWVKKALEGKTNG